jgi:hypothetical protein
VVNTSPCTAVPDTTGTAVFTGPAAAATTVPVCAESADADPPAFEAVTTDRTV